MTIGQRFRLWRLKRKARRLYLSIDAEFNTYDAGRSMINTITGGRLERKERAFEKVMAEIRELDPSAPA